MITLQARAMLAAAVAATLVIAGCGASGSYSQNTSAGVASAAATRASGQVLHLRAAAGGQMRFNMPTLIAAKPGRITLRMVNPANAGVSHGIAIEGHGVDKDGPIVAPGRASSVTVRLKKGRYTYYCPVPGHRQAGMRGTLTVR
jgi:uncharacterized cupredoxin-like copper-binding protein